MAEKGEMVKTTPKIMSSIELLLILFLLYFSSILIPIFLSIFEDYGIWHYNLIGVLIFSGFIFLYCLAITWMYLRRKNIQARMKYNFKKTGPLYDPPSYVGKIAIIILTIIICSIFLPLVWNVCGSFIAILIICCLVVLFGTIEINEIWCKKKRLSRLYFRSLDHFYFWFIPWIFLIIILLFFILIPSDNIYIYGNDFHFIFVFIFLVFFIPITINLINSYIVFNQIKNEKK